MSTVNGEFSLKTSSSNSQISTRLAWQEAPALLGLGVGPVWVDRRAARR